MNDVYDGFIVYSKIRQYLSLISERNALFSCHIFQPSPHLAAQEQYTQVSHDLDGARSKAAVRKASVLVNRHHGSHLHVGLSMQGGH